MRVIRFWLIAMLTVVVTALPCRLFGQSRKLDSLDVEGAHEMLAQVYREVKDHYYDTTYHGVDLKADYQKYNTLLNKAPTNSAAFRIIAAFLGQLHDSHTFFMPPMRVNPSTSGFVTEMIGDKCFVMRIRPGSDAEKKLHVGDQVMGLQGFKVTREDFIPLHYFLQVLSPTPAKTLILESPDGNVRQETIQSMWRTGKKLLDLNSSDFWDLVREGENEDHLDRERTYSTGDLLIWKMPSFMADQDMIDSAFSKARKHKVLILDLRDNSGGAVDTLKQMAANVFDHPVMLYTEVSRKGSKKEIVKPKHNPFTGKLIVLIDSGSASAAELFARVIQLEHRGEVIGDRSAGAVMEAHDYDESIGVDAMTFYGISVTSANLLMSDGKSLENVGVTPDELLLPTAEDMAAGKDPVLAHAADLAGAKLDPTAAGKLFPFEWPPL